MTGQVVMSLLEIEQQEEGLSFLFLNKNINSFTAVTILNHLLSHQPYIFTVLILPILF